MSTLDNATASFILENNITEIDSSDTIYKYDIEEQRALLKASPWKQEPTYFTAVRISAIALLKMTMHARSGGSIEIMGVMTGKIVGREFVVMDAFPLPVEGTETRVNALGEAYEYMVEYLNSMQIAGRSENVVGWYHSHPGYGCWLSGIDVGTQAQNQQFQDPFLAVVIDPDRTIAAGKVDIGAFRTYPEGYITERQGDGTFSVPSQKLEDFGVHADRYYPLEISYFRSSLDEKILRILWSKYWTTTLSNSPLLVNYNFANNQINDLALKINQMTRGIFKPIDLVNESYRSKALGKTANSSYSQQGIDPNEIAMDAIKLCGEELYGLLSRNIRQEIWRKEGERADDEIV